MKRTFAEMDAADALLSLRSETDDVQTSMGDNPSDEQTSDEQTSDEPIPSGESRPQASSMTGESRPFDEAKFREWLSQNIRSGERRPQESTKFRAWLSQNIRANPDSVLSFIDIYNAYTGKNNQILPQRVLVHGVIFVDIFLKEHFPLIRRSQTPMSWDGVELLREQVQAGGGTTRDETERLRAIGVTDAKKLGGGASGVAYFLEKGMAGVPGPCVVKIIEKSNPRTKEEIENEDNILRTIKSKNGTCRKDIVCPIKRIDFPDFAVLAYTFMSTMSLSGFMRNNIPNKLRLVDTLVICEKLLTAVKYLGSRKVVHMDIKPANIIINDNLDIQLIDFGSSCIDKLCKSMGTVGYIAPELLPINKVVEKRLLKSTDVFSLGNTFLELLSVTETTSTYEEELEAFRDLVKLMTLADPKKRMGSQQAHKVVTLILEHTRTHMSLLDPPSQSHRRGLFGKSSEEKLKNKMRKLSKSFFRLLKM